MVFQRTRRISKGARVSNLYKGVYNIMASARRIAESQSIVDDVLK